MKLKKPLSTVGIAVVVAASTLFTSAGAQAADVVTIDVPEAGMGVTDLATTASAVQFTAPSVWALSDGRFLGASRSLTAQGFTGVLGDSVAAVSGSAGEFSFPAVGSIGAVSTGVTCLTASWLDTFITSSPCASSGDAFERQQLTWEEGPNGFVLKFLRPYQPAIPYIGIGTDRGPWPGYSTASSLSSANVAAGALADAVRGSTGVPVTLSLPKPGSTVRTATPEFSGTGSVGAAVEIANSGGVSIGRAIVDADGRWAVPVAPLAEGDQAGLVRQVTGGGGVSEVPYAFRYLAVRPVVVTTPAAGAVVEQPRPVIRGTGEPGAAIDVAFGGANERSYQATVGADGVWSITPTVSLQEGAVEGIVSQRFEGAVSQTRFDFTFIAPVERRPLVVAAPAVGGSFTVDSTGMATPVFTGMATPGADIRIVTGWGLPAGSGTADANGDWSITWNKGLLPSTYTGGSTIQSIGGVTIDQRGYRFTVRAAAAPVALVSPALGGTIFTGDAAEVAPVFVGTGSEGARIEIVGAWGTALGSGVVKSGVWQITWNGTYTPGTYAGGLVKQYLPGEAVLDSTTGFRFTVKLGNPTS